MSLQEIKPILPTAPTGTVTSGGTPALVQLIQGGSAINLQVLKVLTATAVSFQGPKAPITLNFADTTPFVAGDKWVLSTSSDTNELVLRPFIGGKVSGENTSIRPQIHFSDGEPVAVQPKRATGDAVVTGQVKATGPVSGLASPKSLEAVVAGHRHEAAVRQNSLSGAFASLIAISKGQGLAQVSGEEGKAIQDLAKQILGLRVPSEPSAQTVKQAVQNSGVFHEAKLFKLAGGDRAQVEQLVRSVGLAIDGEVIKGDLKQSLQTLLSVLTKAGIKPESGVQASQQVTVPPERDGPVGGQKAALSNIADNPKVVLGRLMEQAVEGLARIRLLQMASLPVQDVDLAQTNDTAKLQYNMELPLALGGDQTAMIGLRVTRDGEHAEHDEHGHGRGWSIDMAMDTEETGPIDAHIHLSAKGLKVSLWAGDENFAQALQDGSEGLRVILEEEGLDIDALQIVRGRRSDLTRYSHHSAGYFLDSSM